MPTHHHSYSAVTKKTGGTYAYLMLGLRGTGGGGPL